MASLSPSMVCAADKATVLRIHIAKEVVHCSVELPEIDKNDIATNLKDGVEISAIWHLGVVKVRDYWLNDQLADITVSRRVKPDLLSRSWQLIEDASGISRRVYSLDQAIYFLSHLQQFAVVDRSLLAPLTLYRMHVAVVIHHGAIKERWLPDFWHSPLMSQQQDFKLP
ncbi:MAG: DUF4390 domain-containing protein [Mariprofundus sp.]|nr:DUF4390 domain-containing protein [Mariprofundus sp.]